MRLEGVWAISLDSEKMADRAMSKYVGNIENGLEVLRQLNEVTRS
jgi:hypothetical protein